MLKKYFREDKIKSIVDDIMEKLPDPFNMQEIMGKVEERTPYVVVAFQVRKNTENLKTYIDAPIYWLFFLLVRKYSTIKLYVLIRRFQVLNCHFSRSASA